MPKLILTTKSRDPARLAVLGIAAIAALAFLGSMIAVLLMHAP